MDELTEEEFSRLGPAEQELYINELLGNEQSAEDFLLSDSDDEEWLPNDQLQISGTEDTTGNFII